MKILFVISIYWVGAQGIMAQQKKQFTDVHSAKRYYAMKGDVVTFCCDSVLLLNRAAYQAMDAAYTQLYIQLEGVLAQTDSSNALQQKLITEKSGQYEDLKNVLRTLRDSTTYHDRLMSRRLDEVQHDLTLAKTDLQKASGNVNDATQQIKKSKRNLRKTQLVSGLMGFAAGMISGVLLGR